VPFGNFLHAIASVSLLEEPPKALSSLRESRLANRSSAKILPDGLAFTRTRRAAGAER
jgi:hypothetical protein